MSGGFFRGTSADQDTRFSNKQDKLLKSQKFAPELDQPVDMSKVELNVIRPWIAKRVTELLGGVEDEVLINYIFSLLDGKSVDGKQMQILLTGFMEKNTGKFMRELWALLLSAQQNTSKVPQQFLDEKEAEILKKKAENDRIKLEIQKKQVKEGGEQEQQLHRKADGDGGNLMPVDDASAHSGFKDPHSLREENKRKRVSRITSGEELIRGTSTSPKPQKRSLSPRSRQSISPRKRSLPDSRSPNRRSPNIRKRSPRVRRSPSVPRYRSPSPYRMSPYERQRSPFYRRRRSRSPIYRRSPMRQPRRSSSPIREMRPRSPARYRSPIRRQRGTPSPVRRRSPAQKLRRSPSPHRRHSPPYQPRSPSSLRGSPVRQLRRSPQHLSPGPAIRRSPNTHQTGRRRLSPVDRRSVSPVRRRPVSPARVRSPSPLKSPLSKSPVHQRRLTPPRRRHTSPYRTGSPSVRSQQSMSMAKDSHGNGVRPSANKLPVHSAENISYLDDRDVINAKGSDAAQKSPKRRSHRPIENSLSLQRSRSDAERDSTRKSVTTQNDHVSPKKDLSKDTLPDDVNDKQFAKKVAKDGFPHDEMTSSERDLMNPAGHVQDVNVGRFIGYDKKPVSDLDSDAHRKVKKRIDDSSPSEGSDSDENYNVHKDDKKRCRKSGKNRRHSEDSSESCSQSDDHEKQAKRRRKEEKKARKEERRRKREERHRRKMERRASKHRKKSIDAVSPAEIDVDAKTNAESDDKKVPRMSALLSDQEVTESEQKKLESELRERALESLRAKKAIGH